MATEANAARPAWRGRGRGRITGPIIGPTPIAQHTRQQGRPGRPFFAMDLNGRNPIQVEGALPAENTVDGEVPGGEQPEDLANRSFHRSHSQQMSDWGEDRPMSEAETNRLKKENEQHRKDVRYYYGRRATLYLERTSRDEGEVVKQGLSAASLGALKKTLDLIKSYQERADENFRLLRQSNWFTEEDTSYHEEWYGSLNETLVALFEQIAEQEKANISVTPNSPNSPSFTPISSSEQYTTSIVEPLKLDTYTGQRGLVYRTFRSRFNLVMKKGKIDEALQAEHLLRCLKGEPLRIVMMVDLEDPEALKEMWRRLDETFGNEQCDYQHHVTELQKLATYPPCKSDADLKELYYTFTEHIYSLRRIAKNRDAGEDYKTTLCGLLPDYLRRKAYKLMQDRPTDYTLNNLMKMVGKQVSLSNMESVSAKDVNTGNSASHRGYGRDFGNPWSKSRVEAEHRAQICFGGVGECYTESSANSLRTNMVTIGEETFSVPGPVARTCYPVQRGDSSLARTCYPGHRGDSPSTTTTHYNFSAYSVPPPETSYTSYSAASGMGAGNGIGSGQMQVNAGRPLATNGSNTRAPAALTNQTIHLTTQGQGKGCIFCGLPHGPLDCRLFDIGNQFIEVLKANNRCFNCFETGHGFTTCPHESTCKAQGCKVINKHSHFYCGHFKTQLRGSYSGFLSYSVDASGKFESVRLHTVLFYVVHPTTGVQTLARGFLDSGCSDTFMLKKCAAKADLPGPTEVMKFSFSAFFHDPEDADGSLVNVIFRSISGDYTSPMLTCITMDRLVQDIPSFQLSEQQKKVLHQRGCNISDTGTLMDGRLPVDVVIGQDLYYKFVGNRTAFPDGMIVVDTVFGHTLGGPVITEIKPQTKHSALVSSCDRSSSEVVKTISFNYLSCALPKGLSRSINMSYTNYRKESAIPEGYIPSNIDPESVITSASVGTEEVSETCLFCGGSHSSMDCKVFTEKEQYLGCLKVQKRCFNCLLPGHVVYFCPTESTCPHAECNYRGKHSHFVCGSGRSLWWHNTVVNTFRCSAEDEQENIKRLSDLETLGIKPEGKEEDPVLEQFNEEVKEDEEKKRIVIKLPWRHNRKKALKSNFPHVFERTNNLYDKLCKESKKDQMEQFEKIMEEQVQMGILEEVADIGTVEEVRERLKIDPFYYDHFMPCHDESSIHYLPYHGVVKASTGKLRVVYDASARPFKGAFALNDCLETGPSLIRSLADILTRFRLRKCAYVADIAKAFLQIVVHPCDRDSLRLIWRKGERVVIYRFNRLPFGLNSSPFVLAATLKFLLEKSDLSKEEVEIILQNFYVDDLVSSKDTEEEVLGEREKVKEELGRGSMDLRKWNSNSVVLKNLFKVDEEESLPVEESVLGIVWDTNSDIIHINNTRILKTLGNRNTKEELFSVMAQVFDPMGLLSPYVFLAKQLLHKTCLAKVGWKNKLPTDIAKEWDTWKADLPKISEMKYERWVSFEEATEFELHGFCDASGDGLAASVYLVSKGGGKVQSRLLRSKTRVSADKPNMTMARKEMCAAVLLSLLMYTTAEAVKDLNITKKVYYTDSMNALYWIVSDHYSWPTFVANRIKQIHQLTNTEDWRYVNTHSNPADLPSRGCLIDVLRDHKLWREGPSFLVTGEAPDLGKMDISTMPAGCRLEYPKVTLAGMTSQVAEKLNLRVHIPTTLPPTETLKSGLTQDNSYYKLMKQTRLLYRSVALLKCRLLGIPVDPESWSWEKVELDWLKTLQSEHFEKEISYCKADKAVRDKIKPQLVKSLSLFWDKDSQLLRCSTRLQEAHIGYSSANPILLPRDDEVTTMLINAIHQRVGHVGVKQTLSSLRAEYWVPQARRIVKTIVGRCATCRRVSASPFHIPPPPPLPECRVTMSKPFSNVGVDFCGPFTLKRSRKWYVAVFTCAVTRAVHFEALSDLSAESFLLAFKRFIGRRGVPELIISDNAKTFKFVARKLKGIFSSPALQKYFAEQRVKWHFYVERAPWHGGFVETCVKLFKGVFKKLIGQAALNPEEFRSMVVEAEGVVNSRPLTYLYEDRKDGEPLTPSKLLNGYNLTDLPPIGRGGIKEKLSFTKRAKLLEKLLNSFWQQWSEEYLNELAERHFSQKAGEEEIREPKVGEVVLLRGELLPRNRWKLGVIESVYRSVKGNRIRSVIVRVPEGKGHKGGLYRRSPKHVVPLEAEIK